jgi:OOP family OmpA-OmpF porin
MKLKNTLALAISTLIAATSLSALAQGQGSVEGQISQKYLVRHAWSDPPKWTNSDGTPDLHSKAGYREYGNDSSSTLFFNPGIRIGYFLTDNVSINLSYDKVHFDESHVVTSSIPVKVRGGSTSLTSQYHFGQAGLDPLRPYIEAGVGRYKMRHHIAHAGHNAFYADRSDFFGTDDDAPVNTIPYSGRGNEHFDGSSEATILIAGAGVKCYFTNNLFALVGVETNYEIDDGIWDYSAQFGLGFNLGGNTNASPTTSLGFNG